ncbi:hypothetical protein VST7929_01574 [Vibrio stylophorae]|uniref:Uncharacterized protein n=1 Tax=Vibrio stylophorae TaxID=659351 RepID=A0ABM8ZTQ4_9VIBR|nr:DUF6694 family lipoprotein [Vibrio stylophorae]CAH0533699.1 hypothetical protein VST7929_01574 [Vibrio stylophorae]
MKSLKLVLMPLLLTFSLIGCGDKGVSFDGQDEKSFLQSMKLVEQSISEQPETKKAYNEAMEAIYFKATMQLYHLKASEFDARIRAALDGKTAQDVIDDQNDIFVHIVNG